MGHDSLATSAKPLYFRVGWQLSDILIHRLFVGEITYGVFHSFIRGLWGLIFGILAGEVYFGYPPRKCRHCISIGADRLLVVNFFCALHNARSTVLCE